MARTQRALGLALVSQGRRVFSDISVNDNLRLGAMACRGELCGNFPEDIFDFFPVLRQRLDQKAHTLSAGEQQMLALARALASRPDMLLLDEPSEGLAPLIVDAIGELLLHLRSEGMTILLAEQNLNFALEITHRGYVFEKGRIVATGTNAQLRDNEIVRNYLMV